MEGQAMTMQGPYLFVHDLARQSGGQVRAIRLKVGHAPRLGPASGRERSAGEGTRLTGSPGRDGQILTL
jgi:hypothetical protein